MQDLTYLLYREYAPSPGPRLDVDIEHYITDRYYLWLQKLVRHRSAFASLVLQKLDGQDRLTEVEPDGGVFQALRRLTPLADTLTIVGEFLSWSADAGFVLALPLYHGDLELDSVGVSTKDHVAVLVAWP